MNKTISNTLVLFFATSLLILQAAILPENTECPPGYNENILILMSLDGFRPDYLTRGLTPNIQRLIDEGSSAPFMIASFPTVTFPNHYTIISGLYPESHGIIANSFYDSTLNEKFSTSRGSEGKFFGGEPIWNTIRKSERKSASYFWVGSAAEIDNMRPDYWYEYDGDVPFEDRIEQVLVWLAMPPEMRPTWISVYFNEPDHTAHNFGPNSHDVNVQLRIMDNIVKSLVDGIANLSLTNCVNLIIVSDHGMSESGPEKVIHLDQYDSSIDEKAYIFYGAHSRIDMIENYKDEQLNLMESLACETDTMRQFDQKSFPKRYHYSNNRRIEDIILGLDAGYAANFKSDFSLSGQHGYDNEIPEMQSLFLAWGPDIKKSTVIRPFQNIELYNLMCDLLSLEPASNNGTKGALYSIMNKPPNYPELALGLSPILATFPNVEDIPDRLTASECDGDLTASEDWIYNLDFEEAAKNNLNLIHLPFGFPIYTSSISSNVTILHHSDHITGYSQSLQMPVWTSFTFSQAPKGSKQTLWSSDVRLSITDTPKCSDYSSLTNYSMNPLFRPEHSQNRFEDRIPFMISNAVPITAELEIRYNELMTELVIIWQEIHAGPMNVIAGPVFDNNFDSLVDNIEETRSFTAPSDLFVIATKCRSQEIINLRDCNIDDLQVSAFIYRQSQTVSNCLDRDNFAIEFSARVKDIELSTGLIFFSDFSYQDAIDMVLRNRLGLWPTVSVQKSKASWNSIPSRLNVVSLITILSFLYYLRI